MATVTTFDGTAINKLSFLFKGNEAATIADCVGKIDGTTKMHETVKKCGKTEVKSISKPIEMALKIKAHVPMAIFRDFYGLSHDERLKKGIYSYGAGSKGKNFSLAVQVEDEYEDEKKLLGFLNCTSSSGLTFSVENGADTVADLELDVKVMIDEFNDFYHEAFLSELNDQDTADAWMAKLNPDVLKVSKSVDTPKNVTTKTDQTDAYISAE